MTRPDRRSERYCDEHEMFKMKNALGQFICPFCEGEY